MRNLSGNIFEMQLEVSHGKKIPCIWESGGGMSNTGSATGIADANGKPKKAIFEPRWGHLACGSHALIPVKEGDLICTASHHRDSCASIFKVEAIAHNDNGPVACLTKIAHFEQGEWDNEPWNVDIHNFAKAMINKSHCYHCRSAFWIA